MVTTSPFYKPLESPPRYPLELRFSDTNDMLEVLLWAENDRHCWVIAWWRWHKEGPELHFVGDRPLDARVKWKHFGKIVKHGQKIAEELWKKRQTESA